MSDAIQQIGAVAGLASFMGLAVLAFLYFMQARHVRDLEEKASYLPDDIDLPTAAASTTPAASAKAPVAAAATAKERKAGAAAPAPPAENPAEVARQVEVARAAAERRQRFQQRRGSSPFSGGGDEENGGGLSSGRPEPRAMIVIGLGLLVLAVGVVFGIGKLTGGDSGTTTTAANGTTVNAEQGTGPPVEVAVLNGTPVPGLAAKIGEDVRNGGGFKLGAVTNTETPFDATEVMYDPSDPEAQANAQTLAARIQVTKVEPMTPEIKKSAEGAGVVVIVGEDRAGT